MDNNILDLPVIRPSAEMRADGFEHRPEVALTKTLQYTGIMMDSLGEAIAEMKSLHATSSELLNTIHEASNSFEAATAAFAEKAQVASASTIRANTSKIVEASYSRLCEKIDQFSVETIEALHQAARDSAAEAMRQAHAAESTQFERRHIMTDEMVMAFRAECNRLVNLQRTENKGFFRRLYECFFTVKLPEVKPLTEFATPKADQAEPATKPLSSRRSESDRRGTPRIQE